MNPRRKWLAALAFAASAFAVSAGVPRTQPEDHPLEMQIRQLDAMGVVHLVSDLRGRNVLAVWPDKSASMTLARQRISLGTLRQRAVDLMGLKVVQRGGIEVAVPACQRLAFQPLAPPGSKRVTLNFDRIIPAAALGLLADEMGLEMRTDDSMPDVDLMIRVENEQAADLAVAIAGAIDVDLVISGKRLQMRRRAADAKCPATSFEWVNDSQKLKRVQSLDELSRFSTKSCEREKRIPASGKEYPCTFYEAYPLEQFTFHGFIKLSDRGRTVLIVEGPGVPPLHVIRGDRISEEFVSVTDVDPQAAHLTRYEWREGRAIAAQFYRVPMNTGIPEAESPEDVTLSPPSRIYPGEYYALEEYLLESTSIAKDKAVARLRDPNGGVNSSRRGNHLGLNKGLITDIDPKGIDLIEIVPDGLGGYRERPVRIVVGVPFEYPRDVIRRTHVMPVNDTPAQRQFVAAALDGEVELLQARLVEGVQMDAQAGEVPKNALIAATAGRQLGAVKWLLSHGAKPDLLVAPDEDTALVLAAFEGDFAIVRALVAAGADVNLADAKERSPLYEAASGGHAEIVELLLSKGANPRARSNIGLTPFTVAAAHGHVACLEQFLAAGVKLDERDRNGYTMMIGAEERGATDAVAWLLKHGAKPGEKRKPDLSH